MVVSYIPRMRSASSINLSFNFQIRGFLMEDDELPSSLSAELAAIGGAVRFRQADDLEEEIREQFSHEFWKEEEASCSSQIRRDVNPISDLLRVDKSVKHGDLTPLELLQAQNQRTQNEVKQEDPDEEEVLQSQKSASLSDDEEIKEESLSDGELIDEMEDPGPSKSRQFPSANDSNESDEYLPSDGSLNEDSGDDYVEEKEEKGPKVKKQRRSNEETKKKQHYGDDGDDKTFESRIRRFLAQKELNRIEGDDEQGMKTIKNDLHINSNIWSNLYKYQKTGVRWMAELREQRVGGILADEMGLGKTVQTAVFLRAIAESKKEEQLTGYIGLGPCLLVCPATLLHQWVKEMHNWHPLCRVAILHSCGSHKGSNSTLINKMANGRSSGSMLITSYSTFYKERKALTQIGWHYVILDEGHKIRNPEALISMAIKEVRTPYRLLLSGSPLQNSLKELWSLIDFIFPARLGTLQTFMEKFSIPITMGGYANATQIQSETAYKCALVLRDAINPFILRRMKKDVKMAIELPNKSEQVLFCDLAPFQRSLYTEYLSSRECNLIRAGRLESFSGLMLLRKLCNHPDLVTGGPNKHLDQDVDSDPSLVFGWPERSGKLQVVRSLLQLWKKTKEGKTKNKILLFSQSRKMLTIMEQMLIVDGHGYLRMDGATPIGKRINIVNEFNETDSIFVFLLTTRVGGVGVNLCAANKVVIFDPDWNPSTDAQARERAWRIGQKREVTVYRLMTTGSIEEKMYHRQIFKQFLANRVLKDPKQRRFLKTNHLHDLFTLSDGDTTGSTDTGTIFAGETKELTKKNFFDAHEKEREKMRAERRKKKRKNGEEEEKKDEEEGSDDEKGDDSLSDQRREALKKFAAAVSRDLSMLIPVKKTKEESDKSNEKGEDLVLAELLSRNGVRSVVKHDEVIGEGKKRSDNRLEESQADSVAKQAAAAIRKRPRFNFLQQNGLIKGRTDNSPGSSSSTRFGDGKKTNGGDLMEAIRERKRRQGANGVPLSQSSKLTKLAEEVKDFLYSCPFSCARTDQIINRFKKNISAKDQLQFRSILKEISHFDSTSKEWQLKEEFR
ncbi:csb-1 [Pristionchus pacificus]|uniref:DNA repair and recombination protein RAD54-like n=1 Tax=Pristionchus pacificus TaxID=54126 RepID=A0A2A6BEA6_PRIPA|nr:csb-1 [Pristionchus pacificus]|eukprot:PDM64203.1 csb-1 [Pristionchus pacificus]